MIIGFIGVGKMATAIINGLNTSSHRIIISGSSLARSRQIAEELEVEAAASHQELLDNADLVILGIKPQMFDKVLADLNFHQPIISMAAGVTLERLASLTSPDLPLIRIMPNLNAQILKTLLVFALMIRYPRTFWQLPRKSQTVLEPLLNWLRRTLIPSLP